MEFKVTYLFGATIVVVAKDFDDASELVRQMPVDQLQGYARDGFQVVDVEELD